MTTKQATWKPKLWWKKYWVEGCVTLAGISAMNAIFFAKAFREEASVRCPRLSQHFDLEVEGLHRS